MCKKNYNKKVKICEKYTNKKKHHYKYKIHIINLNLMNKEEK